MTDPSRQHLGIRAVQDIHKLVNLKEWETPVVKKLEKHQILGMEDRLVGADDAAPEEDVNALRDMVFRLLEHAEAVDSEIAWVRQKVGALLAWLERYDRTHPEQAQIEMKLEEWMESEIGR